MFDFLNNVSDMNTLIGVIITISLAIISRLLYRLLLSINNCIKKSFEPSKLGKAILTYLSNLPNDQIKYEGEHKIVAGILELTKFNLVSSPLNVYINHTMSHFAHNLTDKLNSTDIQLITKKFKEITKYFKDLHDQKQIQLSLALLTSVNTKDQFDNYDKLTTMRCKQPIEEQRNTSYAANNDQDLFMTHDSDLESWLELKERFEEHNKLKNTQKK